MHKVQVNLDDPAWASDVMRRFRPDRIVHLAGLAFGRNDPLLVAPTFATNVKQSVELLEAALAADVNRVVMAGTFEEWDSRDETHPNSPYAASKSAVTVYSQLFAGFGLDVVNAWIFMCYGPGQHPDKLIPSLAASFLAGEEPEVRMPGRACDWIYVDDAAAGLAVLASHPLADRDPSAGMSQFDVGTGTLTSIGEIARLLSTSLGQEFACAAASESDRPVARCADPAPLQALGWTRGRISAPGWNWRSTTSSSAHADCWRARECRGRRNGRLGPGSSRPDRAGSSAPGMTVTNLACR